MSQSAKPRIPVEDKLRIVLSVLRGELSVSEAARRRERGGSVEMDCRRARKSSNQPARH